MANIGWSIKRIVEEEKDDVSPTDLITDLRAMFEDIKRVAKKKVKTSGASDSIAWRAILVLVSFFENEMKRFER